MSGLLPAEGARAEEADPVAAARAERSEGEIQLEDVDLAQDTVSAGRTSLLPRTDREASSGAVNAGAKTLPSSTTSAKTVASDEARAKNGEVISVETSSRRVTRVRRVFVAPASPKKTEWLKQNGSNSRSYFPRRREQTHYFVPCPATTKKKGQAAPHVKQQPEQRQDESQRTRRTSDKKSGAVNKKSWTGAKMGRPSGRKGCQNGVCPDGRENETTVLSSSAAARVAAARNTLQRKTNEARLAAIIVFGAIRSSAKQTAQRVGAKLRLGRDACRSSRTKLTPQSFIDSRAETGAPGRVACVALPGPRPAPAQGRPRAAAKRAASSQLIPAAATADRGAQGGYVMRPPSLETMSMLNADTGRAPKMFDNARTGNVWLDISKEELRACFAASAAAVAITPDQQFKWLAALWEVVRMKASARPASALGDGQAVAQMRVSLAAVGSVQTCLKVLAQQAALEEAVWTNVTESLGAVALKVLHRVCHKNPFFVQTFYEHAGPKTVVSFLANTSGVKACRSQDPHCAVESKSSHPLENAQNKDAAEAANCESRVSTSIDEGKTLPKTLGNRLGGSCIEAFKATCRLLFVTVDQHRESRAFPCRPWVDAGLLNVILSLLDALNGTVDRPDVEDEHLVGLLLGACAIICTDSELSPALIKKLVCIAQTFRMKQPAPEKSGRWVLENALALLYVAGSKAPFVLFDEFSTIAAWQSYFSQCRVGSRRGLSNVTFYALRILRAVLASPFLQRDLQACGTAAFYLPVDTARRWVAALKRTVPSDSAEYRCATDVHRALDRLAKCVGRQRAREEGEMVAALEQQKAEREAAAAEAAKIGREAECVLACASQTVEQLRKEQEAIDSLLRGRIIAAQRNDDAEPPGSVEYAANLPPPSQDAVVRPNRTWECDSPPLAAPEDCLSSGISRTVDCFAGPVSRLSGGTIQSVPISDLGSKTRTPKASPPGVQASKQILITDFVSVKQPPCCDVAPAESHTETGQVSPPRVHRRKLRESPPALPPFHRRAEAERGAAYAPHRTEHGGAGAAAAAAAKPEALNWGASATSAETASGSPLQAQRPTKSRTSSRATRQLPLSVTRTIVERRLSGASDGTASGFRAQLSATGRHPAAQRESTGRDDEADRTVQLELSASGVILGQVGQRLSGAVRRCPLNSLNAVGAMAECGPSVESLVIEETLLECTNSQAVDSVCSFAAAVELDEARSGPEGDAKRLTVATSAQRLDGTDSMPCSCNGATLVRANSFQNPALDVAPDIPSAAPAASPTPIRAENTITKSAKKKKKRRKSKQAKQTEANVAIAQ